MVTQIVLPIEEALSTISGIDELRARTVEGSATITVQFVLERDIEDAAQDVRERSRARCANCRRTSSRPSFKKPIPIPNP